MSFIDWFRDKISGIKNYKVSEDDNLNYLHAEEYVSQISKLNSDILEQRYYMNYAERNLNSNNIFSIEQCILNLFDKRDYLFDKADIFIGKLIEHEELRCSDAEEKLIDYACKLDKTLNKEDVINIDEVFKSGLFFKDEDKYFERLKKNYINKNVFPSDFDEQFYIYKNSFINKDTYFGF